MTAEDCACIHDAVAALRRFEKKGNTWRRIGEQTIEVIAVQKSQFGREYFVGIGLYVRALGTNRAPREEQCHIRARLDLLMDRDRREKLRACLNFESSDCDPRQRCSTITAALRDHALALFERCADIEGLRREVAVAASRRHALVTGSLMTWLTSTAD